MDGMQNTGLDELPQHLLQNILEVGRFGAADLARLEVSSYTFREAGGVRPYRFKSLTENAAFQYCQLDPLFLRLPSALQSWLLRRCGGNWKLVWRFLQASSRAARGVSSSSGTVSVATGRYLTFLTTGSGQLLGCGSNKFGVLGQGPLVDDCRTPVEVPVPRGARVVQVSAAHNHVAFVTEDGLVYTYGDNSSGCCGHGDGFDRIDKPILVESLRDVFCKQVSTGLSFTAALTKEGNVYSWGSGSHGQLGHGNTAEQLRPVQIESLSSIGEVVQVATGTSYTLCVMKNGDVYSFGSQANHCLGHEESVEDGHPHQVAFEGEVFVTSVAAGDEHAAAIDFQGQVYTWGKGYCGALGHGDEQDGKRPKIVTGLQSILAVQVCTRRRKTFVLSDTGDVFVFGWMALGSLGLQDRGESDKVFTPKVLIKYHHVAQVGAGVYHTAVLSVDGSLLSFGDNDRGQLGFNLQASHPDASSTSAGAGVDDVPGMPRTPGSETR